MIARDDHEWSCGLNVNCMKCGKSNFTSKIGSYRIRKPRGMKVLEELLENLPDEVGV